MSKRARVQGRKQYTIKTGTRSILSVEDCTRLRIKNWAGGGHLDGDVGWDVLLGTPAVVLCLFLLEAGLVLLAHLIVLLLFSLLKCLPASAEELHDLLVIRRGRLHLRAVLIAEVQVAADSLLRSIGCPLRRSSALLPRLKIKSESAFDARD